MDQREEKLLALADQILEKLSRRVSAEDADTLNPQALKHITGVMKDLRDLQLVYMQDYQVLENGIEIVTYADGTRMIGNFSRQEQIYEGHCLPPFGYVVLR